MVTAAVLLIGVAAAVELASAALRVDLRARVHSLTHPPGRLLTARLRLPLARALADAEIDVTPEDAVRLWLAGIVGAGLVGASLTPASGILATLAAVLGPPLALRLGAGRHTAKLVAALPDLLDEVAADLRAGGTVRSALDRCADGTGRLAPDLAVIRARVGIGLDLVDALERWATERPYAGCAEVAGALAVATTTGGRSAVALAGLASSLRDRLASAADARALSSQARASAVVVGVAPLAYLVFSSVADPRSVGVLLGTTVGRVCLVVGLLLDVVAALWMRRLLRCPS